MKSTAPRPRVARAAVLCAVLLAGAAGPAWAKDCFIKVQLAAAQPKAAPHAARPHPRPRPHPEAPAVAEAPQPQPMPRTARRHVHRPAKPRVILADEPVTPPPHRQYLESSLAQRSVPVFELRPVACDVSARRSSPSRRGRFGHRAEAAGRPRRLCAHAPASGGDAAPKPPSPRRPSLRRPSRRSRWSPRRTRPPRRTVPAFRAFRASAGPDRSTASPPWLVRSRPPSRRRPSCPL